MIDVEELLRSNTETEVLEFKEAKFNYDTNKLGKYFSALGNEANLAGKDRAYLLFGVKNDKTVVGTQLSDAEINNFKHEIANHTSPTMSFIDVGRFSIGGKDVLCCVIPGSVENVIESDAPESVYRNPFLVSAMVNLNMIDSVGSGIKRLFDIQRKKFFPLPDFDFSGHTVKLTLYGKILDMKYARALANNENLSIKEVMRLDVAQKKNFAERKNASVESMANPMNAAATTTFTQTFAQTFAQKIRSRFKQKSSFKKACDGCFRLMEFVNQNPNISSGELAESLNLSRRTVATYLKYLVDAELLKRIGPDNGGYWVVLGDGK